MLPDLLAPNLAVLFCGSAAGTVSARVGAPYAGPGNAFWPTLREVGLTPVRLEPAEFRRALEFGLGLTDVCKVRSGSDAEIGAGGDDPARLLATVERVRPANLAFVGKRAAEVVLGRPLAYGRQPRTIGGARVWVLPSTSGAARRFWDVDPWRELAAAVASGRSGPAS